jgi:drug/metabolite transporter (DMT)-like permease
MGITFFLWMKGLEYSKDKAKTSTLAYLSPFISFLFISLILKEKILLTSILGLVLIITGIIYQQTEKGRKQ